MRSRASWGRGKCTSGAKETRRTKNPEARTVRDQQAVDIGVVSIALVPSVSQSVRSPSYLTRTTPRLPRSAGAHLLPQQQEQATSAPLPVQKGSFLPYFTLCRYLSTSIRPYIGTQGRADMHSFALNWIKTPKRPTCIHAYMHAYIRPTRKEKDDGRTDQPMEAGSQITDPKS
ncbi:hypothetical protein BKA81DRAFT_370194 [Phyllosticta paracitricarpa]